MKKYTVLIIILCLALLAGCGIFDKSDPAPTPTPDSPAQSTSDPTPIESESPGGIAPEPPSFADREPVENGNPGVIIVPDETPNIPESEPDSPEAETEPTPLPTGDIEIVPVRADAEFCGEWFAREADSSGELRAVKLILVEDGTVHFDYGVPYREVMESFDGRWREEDDLLVLDLYGGPIADDGSYEYDYCRDLDVSFRWEEQGIAMICEHMGGNPLLPGTSGEWFTFRPYDTFQHSGTWSAADADGTERTLLLKENGSCNYRVVNESGVLQAEYDGSWRYKDGQISLSANMCGGEEYDAGRSGQIAGNYAVIGDRYELSLNCTSGSEFTPKMKNGEAESFRRIED
ncbi:MAG: hypothetical protein J6S18_02170 [Oscillospiraceae bacterium]|nr:hypothetical protein [Oscillospiraceae bacterium]